MLAQLVPCVPCKDSSLPKRKCHVRKIRQCRFCSRTDQDHAIPLESPHGFHLDLPPNLKCELLSPWRASTASMTHEVLACPCAASAARDRSVRDSRTLAPGHTSRLCTCTIARRHHPGASFSHPDPESADDYCAGSRRRKLGRDCLCEMKLAPVLSRSMALRHASLSQEVYVCSCVSRSSRSPACLTMRPKTSP
ncbi:hypothetical protein OBBRIDRAFT_120191 [Obba rivulosa]|uniref:Uncharacterized protein n=1 Tax=Obba rivulosa TaxID=1052685 RepID=A0A8E2ATM4_9APHY|nr:hypothetical protein OBBRIDRAFT_120191 [Obba rivulosa]